MEFCVPVLAKLLQHPTTNKRKRAYLGSRKFQAALQVWKFVVEASEVEVVDDQIHYTLQLGFLAKRGTEVYLLQEFIGAEGLQGNRMDPPLQDLQDSILHRELYKLLLSCLVLKNRYACDLFSQAFLLHVHAAGVTKHPLPPAMVQHSEEIYAKLRASRSP